MCQQLCGLEAQLIFQIKSTFLISSIHIFIESVSRYYQLSDAIWMHHFSFWKFLQMCKCVIQPMKRIKNQFSTEFFQILLYTGSFWNYAIGYWILAQFCAIFWTLKHFSRAPSCGYNFLVVMSGLSCGPLSSEGEG